MILAVTPGDPEGIGPEVVWKTLQSHAGRHPGVHLLCVGARKPFEKLGARIVEADLDNLVPPVDAWPFVWLLPAPARAPKKSQHLAGYQSGWSIVEATRLVQSGRAAAIVTGPISKERLQKGGYRYPGHTEFLAELCKKDRKSPDVTMMLANEQLRITLVTTHLALKDVPKALTRAELRRCVDHTIQSLREGWGVRKPRIAICGLNPHAGESGILGREEIRVISPEIRALQKKHRATAELVGPLPSDTLFAKHVMADPEQRFDAVVCMYHDQGLIPVKLLDFPKTVNVTLGLPIIRTSVDHGVGFDIAGQGRADPSSLQSAIRMALQLASNRKKQGRQS
jgi:4-hydroxythreonine-4-phosphate dehydrogenase